LKHLAPNTRVPALIHINRGLTLPPSVRAAARQRRRRQIGDLTGGQLLSQLGVGDSQFALLIRSSAARRATAALLGIQ
jgi:hypothetical protein